MEDMIGCIIQARMGSTRLPGKILKNVDDDVPSLQHTIEQLKFSKNIDKIVIATTDLPEDDIIEKFVQKQNVDCFRGSAENVLDRYYQCAKIFEFEGIVRITADCPLIDPYITDKVIQVFKDDKLDYVPNVFPRTFPDGLETEVIRFPALEIAWKNAKLPSEKEHVTPYFKNNKESFKIKNVENKTDLSHLRWTLDYQEDLELIREIIKKIHKKPIKMEDILELFSKEPNLPEINKGHAPNEGYKKSLEDDKEFLNKK
jgi:spore coat polysaccharide biosynthesis protein SpsF